MSKKTKKIILYVVGSLILILSISYAYFVLDEYNEANTSVTVTSNTLDELTFIEGEPISLVVNQFTLPEGGNNLRSSTTSQVKLVANNKTNKATKYYDVYFDIEDNDYVYTTEEETPEIILSIKDHNNDLVTEIDGLTYISGDVSGFDITTNTGNIPIKIQEKISTNSTTTGTTHTWVATITFVNLDTHQGENQNKTMNANLVLEQSPPPLFVDIILANNGGGEEIELKTINTPPYFGDIETNNAGMYAMEDDYGTSYYFRGAVDNNWVYFAGFYWRIVRINGDGSVKLIYTGTTGPQDENESVFILDDEDVYWDCWDYCEYEEELYWNEEGLYWDDSEFGNCLKECSPPKTSIGYSAFNILYDGGEYIGYMYEEGEHRGHKDDSTIKDYLDTWYEENLLDYEEYLSDFVVCNDRGFITDNWTPIGLPSSGLKESDVSYRLFNDKNPQLICPHKEDRYTVNDTTIGNGKLTYPIGLLTADEVTLAGAFGYKDNENYYLYTNQYYWLVSPYIVNTSSADGFGVYASGYLDYYGVYYIRGGRPVVSLLSGVSASGSGQWNDPYVID